MINDKKIGRSRNKEFEKETRKALCDIPFSAIKGDIRKELGKIKSQRDNLVIKNTTFERENAKLVGEIKELKEKIKKT